MQKKGLQELQLLKSQANQTCTLVNRLVDYIKHPLNGQIQDIRILVYVNTRILFLCRQMPFKDVKTGQQMVKLRCK